MDGNLASCNDTELLWVCIPAVGGTALDGTVQDDMVRAYTDLDDMVLDHKMALGGMALACRYQCGKVLGHMKVRGGMALDQDDMVLVGRACTKTVDHH